MTVLLERISGEYRPLVAIPEGWGREYSLPAGGLLLNRLRFYSYPLPFTTGDLESWLQWARDHAPEHVAEIQTLLDGSSRMVVPLG